MNKFRMSIKEYAKNLQDVIEYVNCMNEQKNLLERLIADEIELENVDIEGTNKKYGEVMRTPVMYNAVIISVYGCFEAYIDRISGAFLDFIVTKTPQYNTLPEKIRNKNVKKSGEFLSSSQRFRNYELTEKEVVNNLYSCLQDNSDYILNTELLLTHGGNLRFEQLTELFSDLGMDECKGRIISDDRYISFVAEKNDLSVENAVKYINTKNREKDGNLFEELDMLVDQRNKVAHGWCVDTRISHSTLLGQIIPFMYMFGSIIKDIFEEEIIKVLNRIGELKSFGMAINVFNKRILCINSKDSMLKKGDYIYAFNEKRYVALHIVNLQRDGKDINEVEGVDLDIGIKVDADIKQNWTFYYV